MNSALTNPGRLAGLNASQIEKPLSALVAFVMLGGGSMILWAALIILRSPPFILQDNVRILLQQAAAAAVFFAILFSYPHFIWSYRFAYQQGRQFIRQHFWPLIAYPLALVLLLAMCIRGWNYPVANLPLLLSLDSWLQGLGVNLYWSRYNGCGQLLLACLLIAQTILAGQHYCMQAYGVALACSKDAGYRLSQKQKLVLRLNMHSLWAMNIFSGFAFFTILNGRDFVYHPATYPAALWTVACVAFALSTVVLLSAVLVPVFKKKAAAPPLLAVVPIIASWAWLQPFWQPFGFQSWVVPLAHGAQYEYFAFRVETCDFDAKMSRRLLIPGMSKRASLLVFAVFVLALSTLLGYLSFIYIPQTLDAQKMFSGINDNIFILFAFLFLSLHHYVVDSVVWQRDSRAKQLLG